MTLFFFFFIIFTLTTIYVVQLIYSFPNLDLYPILPFWVVDPFFIHIYDQLRRRDPTPSKNFIILTIFKSFCIAVRLGFGGRYGDGDDSHIFSSY